LSPSKDFLFQLFNGLEDSFPLSLNAEDLTNLVVVVNVSRGFSFQVSKLHQEVHASILLGHVFEVSCRAKDLTLEHDHGNDETDHQFKVECSVVQGELWALVCVSSFVPRLAGDVVIVGQLIQSNVTKHGSATELPDLSKSERF
jgi:hypothetical protein